MSNQYRRLPHVLRPPVGGQLLSQANLAPADHPMPTGSEWWATLKPDRVGATYWGIVGAGQRIYFTAAAGHELFASPAERQDAERSMDTGDWMDPPDAIVFSAATTTRFIAHQQLQVDGTEEIFLSAEEVLAALEQTGDVQLIKSGQPYRATRPPEIVGTPENKLTWGLSAVTTSPDTDKQYLYLYCHSSEKR